MRLRTDSLLGGVGKIPGYAGHAHFWERLTRRQFLTTATGALGFALGSTSWAPKLVEADEEHEGDEKHTVLPKPIPGGFHASDFGITIPNSTELFHAFSPLAALGNDPISITDFRGLIAAAEIQGHATVTPAVPTGAGSTNRLFFDNDMRFMQGHYIGVDGEQHKGTFGFF